MSSIPARGLAADLRCARAEMEVHASADRAHHQWLVWGVL